MRRKSILPGVIFSVGLPLLTAGVAVTGYKHFFTRAQSWHELYMEGMNDGDTEYCPMPVNTAATCDFIHNPRTDHILCDCSNSPKKMRPLLEQIFEFSKAHPPKGARFIAPSLPGDAVFSKDRPPGFRDGDQVGAASVGNPTIAAPHLQLERVEGGAATTYAHEGVTTTYADDEPVGVWPDHGLRPAR